MDNTFLATSWIGHTDHTSGHKAASAPPPDESPADSYQQVRSLHAIGVPIYEIVNAVGMPHKAVLDYLIGAGLRAPPDPNRCTPWTDAEIAFLYANYKQGSMSAAAIGTHLGRTRNEVVGKARRLGLGELTPARLRTAIRLRSSGLTYREIGRRMCLPDITVSRELALAGHA